MSHPSMSKDRTKSKALFARHDMTVDEATSEMIELVIKRGSNLRPKQPPLRLRLKKVITHAKALLRYSGGGQSRNWSIQKRQKSLVSNLDDIYVVVALGCVETPFDANPLLQDLDKGKFEVPQLERLLQAAEAALENKSFGRPVKPSSYIIRAAVIAWIRANKTSRYTFIDQEGLKGEFVNFLHDLFEECEIESPSDASIQWRLREPENLFDMVKEKF